MKELWIVQWRNSGEVSTGPVVAESRDEAIDRFKAFTQLESGTYTAQAFHQIGGYRVYVAGDCVVLKPAATTLVLEGELVEVGTSPDDDDKTPGLYLGDELLEEKLDVFIGDRVRITVERGCRETHAITCESLREQEPDRRFA